MTTYQNGDWVRIPGTDEEIQIQNAPEGGLQSGDWVQLPNGEFIQLP